MLGSGGVITSGPNVVSGSGSSISGPGGGVPGSGNTIDQNLELLFNLSPIEVKDEFDEKMCRTYLFVQNRFQNKSEQQAHEELFKMSRESQIYHEEISLGLLTSMLLEPSNAQRYYRDLIHITHDGMTYFNFILNHLINEKYFRLHEHSRKQLLWLLKELLRNQFQGVEFLYYNIFRNIVPGDVTPKNLWLVESVLDILIELRVYYDQNSVLQTFALYKYLRLIVDHTSPSLANIRMKEIKFCICLLQEHFIDFLVIGRDLIRLLQQVSRIPEFERFLKDLLTNPTALAPKFHGIVQLMKIRTPRRYIKLLLTQEMEKKLLFLTSQVRFGHQRRYQEWIQKQYFGSPESQMLRADLVRFICCYIHPSNETIASDVIPRWAVIGWLLNTCPSGLGSAYAKLALFFDWFFFDDKDAQNNSIMDIEPGMLVIFYSLRNYPGITATLLDFLCRISNEFFPPLVQQIKQGIRTAFVHLCEKRVITSLSFMCDSSKIEHTLRQLVQKTFPELFVEQSPMIPQGPYMGMGPGVGAPTPPQQQPLQQTPYMSGQPPQGLMVGPSGQYYGSSPSSAQLHTSGVSSLPSSLCSSTTTTTSSVTEHHCFNQPLTTHLDQSGCATNVLTMVGSGGLSTIVTTSTPLCSYDKADVGSTMNHHDTSPLTLLTQASNISKTNSTISSNASSATVSAVSTIITSSVSATNPTTVTTTTANQTKNLSSANSGSAFKLIQSSILSNNNTISNTTTSSYSTIHFNNNNNNNIVQIPPNESNTMANYNSNNSVIYSTSMHPMSSLSSASSTSSSQSSPSSAASSSSINNSSQSLSNQIPSTGSSVGVIVPMTNVSCFSDDEDDTTMPNSSSAPTSNSGSGKPAVKRLKKSNSFGNGKSNLNANISSTNATTNSTPTTAANNGNGTNFSRSLNNLNLNNSSSLSSNIVSTSPSVTSTNHPEYIASILNSSVNNNFGSGGGGGLGVITNNNNGNGPNSVIINSSSNNNNFPNNINCGNNNLAGGGGVGGGLGQLPPIMSSGLLTPNDTDGEDVKPDWNNLSQQLNHIHNNVAYRHESTLSPQELAEHVDNIQYEEIRSVLLRMLEEKNKQTQLELMEELVQNLIHEDFNPENGDDNDDGNDFNSNMTIILLAILEDELSRRIFPFDYTKPYSSLTAVSDDDLKRSVTGQLFTMFRSLTDNELSYENRVPLKTLICEMGANNSRVGFCLIYYLVVTNRINDRMDVYREYVRFSGKDFLSSLLSDLNNCAHHDVNLFFYLLPSVYSKFHTLIGNAELLSYVVAFADFNHIQYLITQILDESMKMLKRESIVSTLAATLEFPSIEQNFVWQLLEAHDFSIESYISILPKMDHNVHSAALSNLLQALKREEPSQPVVKQLFNREIKQGDNFTITILLYWAKHYSEKLADLIGNFVSTIISSPNKRNKRTINNVSKSQMNKTASVEQILYYLDEMRKTSKNSNFFSQEFLIIVLDQLKQICTPAQKTKYTELFANLPDDNDNSRSSGTGSNSNTTNSSTNSGGGGSKKTNKKNQNKNSKNSSTNNTSTSSSSSNNNNNNDIDSETESDSSEDEVFSPIALRANARKAKRKRQSDDIKYDSD